MESKSFPALLIMVFMKIITVLTYPLSNWLPFPPSVPSYSPSLPPSFLPSAPPPSLLLFGVFTHRQTVFMLKIRDFCI